MSDGQRKKLSLKDQIKISYLPATHGIDSSIQNIQGKLCPPEERVKLEPLAIQLLYILLFRKYFQKELFLHSRLTKNCVNAHSKVFGKGNHLFLRIPISVHVFSAGSYLCVEDCQVVDDAGGGDVDVGDDKENNADANYDENDTDADGDNDDDDDADHDDGSVLTTRWSWSPLDQGSRGRGCPSTHRPPLFLLLFIIINNIIITIIIVIHSGDCNIVIIADSTSIIKVVAVRPPAP